MIRKFLAQDEKLEAFITCPAGFGKTTNLEKTIWVLNVAFNKYGVI